MTRMSTLFARFAIAIALGVAMVGSGFAHQVLPVSYDDELRDYVAAGGSLADLCGEADAAAGETCNACRLVDHVSSPSAGTAMVGYIDCKVAAQGFVATSLHNPVSIDPTRLTRAPPAV